MKKVEDFRTILKELVKSEGKDYLFGIKCLNIIRDLSKDKYELEINTLAKAIDLNIPKNIAEASDLLLVKKQCINEIHKKHGLEIGHAIFVVDALADVLRDDKTRSGAPEKAPKIPHPVKRGANNTKKEDPDMYKNLLDLFNTWAADLEEENLPQEFMYLKGDMKIQKNQKIEESLPPSAWITNRDGNRKFLLPNPKIFDKGTDVTSLYAHQLSHRKPKGQNRIKIIVPCEMIGKSCYIEKQGRFEYLEDH